MLVNYLYRHSLSGKTISRSGVSIAVLALGMQFAAGTALAQPLTTPTEAATEAYDAGEADESAAKAEITVTGSRIARNGYAMPTPVTVVGTQEIQASAPANVADYVNQLPAISGSSTPSGNHVGIEHRQHAQLGQWAHADLD
jgi:iron complex outermembrane receptor protein